MIRAHRTSQRVRIVGDAEPSAQHGRLRHAVRHAEARREQVLLHLDSKVLRHAADAADLHHVRVEVIPFEAAILARRDGEKLIPRAVRQRDPGADLPLVPHVEAVLPAARRIRRYVQLEAASL